MSTPFIQRKGIINNNNKTRKVYKRFFFNILSEKRNTNKNLMDVASEKHHFPHSLTKATIKNVQLKQLHKIITQITSPFLVHFSKTGRQICE